MVDNTVVEIRDLLVEIRDLLLPVADAHQDDYERRLAEREKQRIAAIRGLLSNQKRRKAWALADGRLTQRELARQSGMDEGGASRFFKSLRALGAVGEGTHPKRIVDLQDYEEQ